MRVHISSDRVPSVTEGAGNDLKWHALCEHESRRCVPQCVESQLAEPCGGGDLVVVAFHEVVRVDWSAERCSEHVSAVLPARAGGESLLELAPAMLTQRLSAHLWE